MKDFAQSKYGRWTLFFILTLIAVRLMSLGIYPLYDTTEPRYAEIARKMLELGDWITPYLYYEVPFWGKPPFSFWMTAISFKFLGINEFAARFPSLLAMIAVAGLITYAAKKRFGKSAALLVALMAWTTPVFFLMAGTVLTDTFLTLGTTLTMVAGHLVLTAPADEKRRGWGYLFFVGLAISMLSKGPIGVVLSAMPVGLYVIIRNQWVVIWKRLPWIFGTLLTAALSLPWYYLAEKNSPGFIDYFIVGEHFRRFVDKGWKGDLYGKPHIKTYGSIWGFWLTATIPWCLHFLSLPFFKGGRALLKRVTTEDRNDFLYFFLWAISPALFFTLSASILIPYVLPGVPAFAFLMGHLWFRLSEGRSLASIKSFLLAVMVVPLLSIGGLAFFLSGKDIRECHKELVEDFNKMKKSDLSRLIYLSRRKFSAEFYSQGKLEVIDRNDHDELMLKLEDGVQDYFAIEYHDAEAPNMVEFLKQLDYVGKYSRKKYEYLLYREKSN